MSGLHGLFQVDQDTAAKLDDVGYQAVVGALKCALVVVESRARNYPELAIFLMFLDLSQGLLFLASKGVILAFEFLASCCLLVQELLNRSVSDPNVLVSANSTVLDLFSTSLIHDVPVLTHENWRLSGRPVADVALHGFFKHAFHAAGRRGGGMRG